METNDGPALLKLRVIAGHVSFEPMWLELGLGQYPLHGSVTQLQH